VHVALGLDRDIVVDDMADAGVEVLATP